MPKIDVIEIGGRRYDTKSGELLVPESSTHKKATGGKKPVAASSANNIVSVNYGKSKPSRSVHKVARYKTSHPRQKATTLLRVAVKKPSLKKEPPKLNKVSLALGSSQPNHGTVLTKKSPEPRSGYISKFSPLSATDRTPVVKHLEVKEHRTDHSQEANFSQPIAQTTPTENPFHTAVERATSHIQTKPHHHRVRKHVSKIMSRLIVAVVLATVVSGVVLYLWGSTLAVELAGYEATVSAKLPGALPAGYSLQTPVASSPGQVSLTFVDGPNSFALTEESTTWSSAGLQSNYVVTAGQPYSTLYSGDQAIYVFNDNSATWVRGSVWYRLSSSALSNQSIKNLAPST